jgi:hypothetical protein
MVCQCLSYPLVERTSLLVSEQGVPIMVAQMLKLQILVAGIPETNGRIAEIFADCVLTVVSTLEEAETALSGRYDALLIAVRFNESRMFDLLRHVRTSGASDRLAVICYRSTSGPVTTAALALEAVKLASHAQGAKAFFDFMTYPDQESGNRAIRELVGKLATRALGKRTASALGTLSDPALPSADTTMDIIQ